MGQLLDGLRDDRAVGKGLVAFQTLIPQLVRQTDKESGFPDCVVAHRP
jgi:hypothetical protein